MHINHRRGDGFRRRTTFFRSRHPWNRYLKTHGIRRFRAMGEQRIHKMIRLGDYDFIIPTKKDASNPWDWD